MALLPKLSLRSFYKSLDTRDIAIKYLAIIVLGGIIVYFDELEIVDPWLNTNFILALSIGKTAAFVVQSLRKIAEVVNKNVAYFRFLIFMMVNVVIIVVSFGIDFFCLYRVDPSHFEGMPEGVSSLRVLFESIYVSMLGFNNLGFYDVVPVSVAAKFLVMIEILIYYFSIIMILSDFISLRDSIIEERVNRRGARAKRDRD